MAAIVIIAIITMTAIVITAIIAMTATLIIVIISPMAAMSEVNPPRAIAAIAAKTMTYISMAEAVEAMDARRISLNHNGNEGKSKKKLKRHQEKFSYLLTTSVNVLLTISFIILTTWLLELRVCTLPDFFVLLYYVEQNAKVHGDKETSSRKEEPAPP